MPRSSRAAATDLHDIYRMIYFAEIIAVADVEIEPVHVCRGRDEKARETTGFWKSFTGSAAHLPNDVPHQPFGAPSVLHRRAPPEQPLSTDWTFTRRFVG